MSQQHSDNIHKLLHYLKKFKCHLGIFFESVNLQKLSECMNSCESCRYSWLATV